MKKSALIFLILLVFILSAPSTLAWSFSDIPGFYGKTASEAGLTQTDYTVIVANIITIILSLVGAIFLTLFIYGGITWMTSAGSEDKIGKARKTLTYAVIGVAVVASAYAITTFVVKALPGGQVETPPVSSEIGVTSVTCVSQGGVCATYDNCTRQLQGTPAPTQVTSDCGDQICCKQPPTRQFVNCSLCGKGKTAFSSAVNICTKSECESMGCGCKFTLPFYCDFTPAYKNSTCN